MPYRAYVKKLTQALKEDGYEFSSHSWGHRDRGSRQKGVYMTDVYVISGFLGAGKTTLIKTMVRSALRNKKIVVIENDFGEAGIDAGLLKECSLAVTSLSDG